MRIGVDFYPEHWERERLKTDISLMKQAYIKVVRIGEFSWSLYEPSEGEYCFGWMDEILDLFKANEMKVVLCTPSATPPKWMADQYPEIYQKDIFGKEKVFGTRRHYCYNSRLYREKLGRLTEHLVKRYGNHPAVEAWQVDNELGWSDTTRCYCEKCEHEFKHWMKEKYQTIEALNQKIGTVFWSQTYRSFDELILPRAGACYDTCHETQGQNPGLLLDYYRFASDSVIDFMKETVMTLKQHTDRPITTNLLDASVNSGTGIDYFKLSEALDVVTWDNYIEFQWGIAKQESVSKDHALLRSYKKQPFWVMEQQSGPCGWSKMGPAPTPGKLRLWTYQAVANGADTVVYFRWRTCPFGTEEYWHGILGHDGKVNRRYEEIARVGQEMEDLNLLLGTIMPKAQVAIIKSFDSEWSHSIHSHVEGFDYDKMLLDFYQAFRRAGAGVDFVCGDEDLSGYQLVIAPAYIIVDENAKKNLELYAIAGGHCVITYRSGIKDECNNFLMESVPGVFGEMAGVSVEEYDPQYMKSTASSGIFGENKANLWCDIVSPDTAKTLGIYTEDYYAGRACLTENHFGNGLVYYLGCDMEEEAAEKAARYFCKKANITTNDYYIKGVEIVEATDENNEIHILLNHNDYPIVVPVKCEGVELITGMEINGLVKLETYGVAIIK